MSPHKFKTEQPLPEKDQEPFTHASMNSGAAGNIHLPMPTKKMTVILILPRTQPLNSLMRCEQLILIPLPLPKSYLLTLQKCILK